MKNYDGRWQSCPVEFCRWGCFWEQFQGKGAFSHVRQVLLLFWTKNYALIVSVSLTSLTPPEALLTARNKLQKQWQWICLLLMFHNITIQYH